MSFDGVFTHLMVNELSERLLFGRISKIQQPYENEVILIIRSKGKNHKLLLSAHPSYARVQLTTMDYLNPETPPNFVMMLRKHLDGAILEGIEQIDNDRVLHFTFKKRDELGDLQQVILVVELMGRHSTVLLLNKETGKILDAIKHIGISQNTYRSLLPGAEYLAPPQQSRVNPFTATNPQIFEILSTLDELTGKALQEKFQGLGKDTADELAFRLQAKPNDKMAVWQDFMAELKHVDPVMITTENKEFFMPIPFSSLKQQVENEVHFSSLSELLDAFYHDKAERDRVKQQAGELLKKIENELKRNQLKLKKRQQTLLDSEGAESYRQKGELLTTFMAQVPRGVDFVELENYYDENKLLKISLDPALTTNQNAQKYFTRYQKLRNAVKVVGAQIEETKQELHYLESVLAQLEIAGPMDIQYIREELIDQGYLKQRTTKKKKRDKPTHPEKFLAPDGTEILVGKNNLQNDQLTLRTARKTDYWLHAKDIPGSHVIIRSSNPTQETILTAVELAAYYSKYRHSAQVPVDLVQVKYIRKPNGAKPGYVIYENQKTYFVTPHEENILKLKA